MDSYLAYQPSLFDGEPIGFDPTFAGLSRIQLDEASWVDHAPAWLRGSDAVFAEVLVDRDWGQRTRWCRSLLRPTGRKDFSPHRSARGSSRKK